jgi:hypothetical protein
VKNVHVHVFPPPQHLIQCSPLPLPGASSMHWTYLLHVIRLDLVLSGWPAMHRTVWSAVCICTQVRCTGPHKASLPHGRPILILIGSGRRSRLGVCWTFASGFARRRAGARTGEGTDAWPLAIGAST